MTTYNTGNPIGSKDPRDLYDNAENLDVLVNDKSKLSHPDRLGVERKTWHGMEQEFDADQAVRENEFSSSQIDKQNRFNNFIASSGYQFLGDYAAGIEITEYNQIIRDADGEFWRLSGQVELPYTTTGAGLPEDDSLTPLGDAVLRQELANPDMGAPMVARSVVTVDNFNALTNLPADQKRTDLRYLVCGSVFRWDDLKTMFIPEGPVKMAAFGAGLGGDDTAAFHQAAAYFNSLGYADIDFEDKSYYINTQYGMDLRNIAYFRTSGMGARITIEKPTQVGSRVVFNLVEVPYVLAEGIVYTMRVLDNSTPSSDDQAGSRGYAIRATNPNPDAPYGNPGHVCIIRNNVFIDEAGIPNTTFRPFSGCFQVSGYGLVRILDNEFINGVGRVCYVNDSTNVVIARNRFKNINYTPFPVATPLGTLAVRILSSKGVRIYDNDFEVAEENNHRELMTIVTLAASSQYPDVRCEDVRIFENRIKAKNCDNIWAVRASFCRNLRVYGNTFNGNPDAASSSRFFYIEPLTSETMAAYDIQVYENTIDPAYAGVILQSVGAVDRSGEISVYGNHLKFHSAVVNDAILIPGEYEGVLDNKVYLDGELQGTVSGRNYYDTNAIGKRHINIGNSNLADYVDSNGVLALPKDAGVVSFLIDSKVDITDITVGGAKPDLRSVILYDRRVSSLNGPTIKHDSDKIRLPGGMDHKLTDAPLRLMVPGPIASYWMAV